MNASTSDTLAGQKRLAARLIARYKRNADALPSSGFGLRAKVLSAILLMRGYEAFMYSKRSPYPKVLHSCAGSWNIWNALELPTVQPPPNLPPK